jgi:hypothetical protein
MLQQVMEDIFRNAMISLAAKTEPQLEAKQVRASTTPSIMRRFCVDTA